MTKILLVEDDKSLREIYGVRLLAEGYDIVSAGDGEEALAMAIKDRPGLIVSDVMMPKISGFDMLDILRSTTETKDIKVIMMTALSSEEQRQRGVALGADRYLVKSQVGIEDVVRTVHEVLGDAPVAGQTPLMTPKPAPAPTLTPVAAGPGARPSAPATPHEPTPVAPAPMPAPTAPTPVPAPTSSPQTPPESALPQPTAPFSTPRVGTLADRVIQPLAQSGPAAPDFNSMIEKELSGGAAPVAVPAPTPAPVAPAPSMPTPMPAAAPASSPTPAAPAPAPVAPVPSAPSGLDFEETPRPVGTTPAPSVQLPQPPQPPATGV